MLCGGQVDAVQAMLALLLHEAWVTLQHGNVLLNPFCQRLDRRYGISMLRKGRFGMQICESLSTRTY